MKQKSSSINTDDDHCLNLVRENAIDLYLADLLLDRNIRADIVALHAFHVEIRNAVLQQGEPMAAEIRLQWWREVLSNDRADEAGGHPVARNLLRAIGNSGLPTQPLINKLDAHVFDLYNDPMGDRTMWEGYCGETRSSLFQLSAMIAGAEADTPLADACGHAGVVMATVTVIANLAQYRSRNQVYLPSDLLASVGFDGSQFLGEPSESHNAALIGFADLGYEHFNRAKQAIAELNPKYHQIFKPLAVAPFYLDRARGEPKAVYGGVKPPSQLRRQWALWRF